MQERDVSFAFCDPEDSENRRKGCQDGWGYGNKRVRLAQSSEGGVRLWRSRVQFAGKNEWRDTM